MCWERVLTTGLLAATLAGCAAGGGDGRPAGEARPAPAVGASGSAPGPGAPAAPAAARPLEKTTFALPAVAGGFVPHYIAQQKGFFHEEGLEVELPAVRSNLIPAALSAGEADYAGHFSPTVRNAIAGQPHRLAAAVVAQSTRWLIVTPAIQSPQQLRGRVVAVNAIGSGPYNSGVITMEHFGIDPRSEVTWLAVGGPAERFAVMQQGGADATIASGSEVPMASQFGLVPLLDLNEVAPLPETGVTTTVAKLENDRGQVKRVVRAIVRASRFTRDDREGSLPYFMQFLSLSREEAALAYDGTAYAFSADGTVSERALRYTIEAEKQQLDVTDDVPASRVADFGPLYEVLAEMGITPAAGAAR
jgi:NitT/TauT family transport system substrate-binding protein